MSAGAPAVANERIAEEIALDDLDLDITNPRFGDAGNGTWTQIEIVDHIVRTYGVDDVLSSMAVNGYFKAEPLVGRRRADGGRVVVAEGNRRLVGLLILSGDPRAGNHKARTTQYKKIWQSHGSKPINPVPVIVFDEGVNDQSLLSYLGVRHIAASQPWDSYAKAAWVARVVEAESLTVAEVAEMIGDQHRTVNRLLEGYYFVNQAIEENQFRPQDSIRPGRGSMSEYPFSWIYTILGYTSARNYLGLKENSAKPRPVAEENLPKARLVLRAMFGNRAAGANSAVSDSRELGDLASALSSPEKVALIEAGRTISDISRLTMPIDERLRRNLAGIRELQAEILAGMSEEDVSEAVAVSHMAAASMNRRAAIDVEKRLGEVAKPTFADD